MFYFARVKCASFSTTELIIAVLPTDCVVILLNILIAGFSLRECARTYTNAMHSVIIIIIIIATRRTSLVLRETYRTDSIRPQVFNTVFHSHSVSFSNASSANAFQMKNYQSVGGDIFLFKCFFFYIFLTN